jgi:hypothetical protein
VTKIPLEERIQTGADWRLKRLREMLSFIAVHESKGVSNKEVLAMMGLKFGLKFKTTASYIAEMHQADMITQNDHNRWITTNEYRKMRKLLYSE